MFHMLARSVGAVVAALVRTCKNGMHVSLMLKTKNLRCCVASLM